jgi:hypothetical protein
MSALRNISRPQLVSIVAAVVLAGVPAAVVVADADDQSDVDEGGALFPPRAGPPKVVASGITDDGRRYFVRTSWSAQEFPDGSKELCISVEYRGRVDDPDRPPVTSEICALPDADPIIWTMDEVFIDAQTQQPLDKPQRFIYGLATDRAATVRVRGPNGKDRKLATAELPDAPGQVFAGSAPEAGTGSARLTAETGSGLELAQRSITFHGLARVPAPAALGSPSH